MKFARKNVQKTTRIIYLKTYNMNKELNNKKKLVPNLVLVKTYINQFLRKMNLIIAS
jgi:hypothetical protein